MKTQTARNQPQESAIADPEPGRSPIPAPLIAAAGALAVGGIIALAVIQPFAALIGMVVLLGVVAVALALSRNKLRQQLTDLLATPRKQPGAPAVPPVKPPLVDEPGAVGGSGEVGATVPRPSAQAALPEHRLDPQEASSTKEIMTTDIQPPLQHSGPLALTGPERSQSQPFPVAVSVLVPRCPVMVYVVASDVVVGRGVNADLDIHDPTVSRQHVRLSWVDDAWRMRAITSSSRTEVNGEPVPRGHDIELFEGDVVSVGNRGVVLHWGVDSVETAATATPPLGFEAAANTTPGRRPRNEDDYLVLPFMVAVADGAGGEPAGATASATAIASLQAPEASRKTLDDLVAQANDDVLNVGQRHPATAGMMTTLDVVRIVRQGTASVLEVAHLGDGAVFLQHPDGAIQRLTTPHRSLSPDGRRTFLDRSLGSELAVEPQYVYEFAQLGQRIVLATDGLLDHFHEDGLITLLDELRSASPRRAVDSLVRKAANEDAQDNVTVVIADVHTAPLELPQTADVGIALR